MTLKKTIEEVVGAGGIYLGVSCGSLILGHSILLAEKFTKDNHDIKIKDFSGLNIVPYITMPHYDESVEERLAEFEKEYGLSLLRLRDGEAFVFDYISHKGELLR